jgi:hypothetical protein
MNMTGPFVLKQDVLLVPCAQLSEELRAKLAAEEGDYTLSHKFGRTLAQVVDGDTAALLSLFREPRTLVEAVVESSRTLGRDPRVWFDQLLPHLGKFVRNRVLVPAGSEEEKEVRPQFESGAVVAGWTIVRCVNLVEDTELYEVRGGALKIARFASREMQNVFANETEILRLLDGSIAPRLLDEGVHDEKPFVVMEWVHGVDALVAATQRRHDRPALLDLCASIAEAYAELHARGVVHADVHAKNILVGERVTLLDFGFSRLTDREPRMPRGGMYTYFEPEYFAHKVHSSSAGEQYSLAALLYFLIAREHYVAFSFDREEMMRQAREDAPLPFAQRGVPPWPEVEALLFRALSKDPPARFASMRELAALLRNAADAASRDALDAPLSEDAQAFLEATLASFARGGEMFASRYTIAPTASITFGAAGAAVGLLRIAETRGDAALLALADVWRSRAAASIGADGAFTNPERGLGAGDLGDVTPYHTESGVHAAAAMIAYAFGDASSLRRAVSAFLHASKRPCAELDLTLGRSGSLLAASMLLPLHDDRALRAFGSNTMQEIWTALDARPPIADSPQRTFLGIAHGWAGYLYATLRWCSASGDALPAQCVGRLEQLAALRVPKGRGAWWPRIIGSDHNIPGWCNGSAGHVFLFTLAAHVLGDPHWLTFAELAAWNAYDEPRGLTSLCCGTSGRAYSLLALYKHTGSREWLARARSLANHAAHAAAATTQSAHSLWRGELGVATLIADLASPENARMPFFE